MSAHADLEPTAAADAADLTPAATAEPAAAAPALTLLPPPAADAADAEAEAEQRPPSTLERATAAFASKSNLVARNNDLTKQLEATRAEVATLRADRAGLEAQVDHLTASLESARKELSDIEALLKTAEAEKQTVEEAAAHTVAAIGFPAASLPGAETELPDDLTTLSAKLEKEKDPTQRWKLARQISALRWEAN